MIRSSLGNRTFHSVNAHPLIKSQSVRTMNTFSPLTKPPNNAHEYIYNNYHNRPANQSTPYKPMYKPGKFIVPSSNEKEHNALQKRLIDRELTLKDSESVIDDIELYGLIATNELLAVDRAQQRLGKVDITHDIHYFATRIDQQSRKACDGIIKDCQDLGDEINNIHDAIHNHLDRNDITIRSADKHNELVNNFEKMKTNLHKGIVSSVKRTDDNAEKVRQMADCIKTLDVQVIKEDVLKCQVDWKKRKEVQKECYALQRMVDEYYNPELEEINKKNCELNKQVLMTNNARKKTKKRQIELNRSRERRKYELMRLIEYVKMKVKHLEQVEQLVNERKEMMRKQYENMLQNAKQISQDSNVQAASELQKKESNGNKEEDEYVVFEN